MAGYRRTGTAFRNSETYEDLYERETTYNDSIRKVAGGIDRRFTDRELFTMSALDDNFGLGLSIREAVAEAFVNM